MMFRFTNWHKHYCVFLGIIVFFYWVKDRHWFQQTRFLIVDHCSYLSLFLFRYWVTFQIPLNIIQFISDVELEICVVVLISSVETTVANWIGRAEFYCSSSYLCKSNQLFMPIWKYWVMKFILLFFIQFPRHHDVPIDDWCSFMI